MSSASGVVGPLAASMITCAFTCPALASVIWLSSAAGMSTSQSSVSRSSLVMDSPPANPATVPASARCSANSLDGKPRGL